MPHVYKHKKHRHSTLVLGAFGCGAFGNPPQDVARCFASALASDEFRGEFARVVFAIVDPKQADLGNLVCFRNVLRARLCAEPEAVTGGARL